jgi:hypothetical protein
VRKSVKGLSLTVDTICSEYINGLLKERKNRDEKV